jgi:adenine C2-methylase RlmN of 23S rRNA A2503 and tRNA A37
MVQVLRSKEDASVNFVFPNGLESRFVQRDPEYFIVYLSSHRGCNRACRFCHLTQTGQTDMTPATVQEVLKQAEVVKQHYVREVYNDPHKECASVVHFNWMARGEVLMNSDIMKNWYWLVNELREMFYGLRLKFRFNISSIIPEGDIFLPLGMMPVDMTLYYSLYSVNPEFRKRWLPKAVPVDRAFQFLNQWQKNLDQSVVFHWAFIDSENDSEEDVAAICKMIKDSGIKARMNVVRYNPFGPGQGKESSEEVIQARFEQLKQVMLVPGSRIVPRVGFDVMASCGCFVPRNIIPIKHLT